MCHFLHVIIIKSQRHFFCFDSRQVCRKFIPFANQNYLNDSFCAFLSFKASVLSGSLPWKFKYFHNKKGKYFYIFTRWFNTLKISYKSLYNSAMRQSIIQRIHLKFQLNPFSGSLWSSFVTH